MKPLESLAWLILGAAAASVLWAWDPWAVLVLVAGCR